MVRDKLSENDMEKGRKMSHQGEPVHYRYKNFFVGLFVLIPILLIPAFMIFTLVKSDFMENWVYLTIRYNTVYGLRKGAAVNYQGVEVGDVEFIYLTDDGEVEVVIRVKDEFFPIIKKGCVARLGQKNFVVGDWEINLIRDLSPEHKVRNGGDIASVPAIPLGEAVEKLTSMVSIVDTMFQNIRSGEGLLGKLMGGDTLVNIVTSITQRIDGLLTGAEELVSGADNVVGTLNSFGKRGTETVDSLMVFTENATQLSRRLNLLTGKIDTLVEGFDDMPEDVEDIFEGLKRGVKEAEILLKGIQRHWFFRRSVEKAKEEMIEGEED